MTALFLFAAILWIWGGAGKRLLFLMGFKKGALSAHESAVFSIGLGLAALSFGILALGMAGMLRMMPVLLLTAIPAFLWKPFDKINVRFSPGWALVFALPICLSLLKALTPAIGNDALAYHLAHPKEFIRLEKIAALPF